MQAASRKRRSIRILPTAAFTLVELLVVISIIAVLATLLLPAMARAKAKGKLIVCQSNLRQLGLELAMYVNEHLVYPHGSYVTWNLVGTQDAIGLLQREEGIKRCPTRVYPTSVNPGGLVVAVNYSTSYGYNESGYLSSKVPLLDWPFGLGSVQLTEERGRQVHETEVKVPSDMIALGDHFTLVPGGGSSPDRVGISTFGLNRQEAFHGGASAESVNRAEARHLKRGNIVFCDGHVESLAFKRLFLDRDDASLRRWNRDNEPHR